MLLLAELPLLTAFLEVKIPRIPGIEKWGKILRVVSYSLLFLYFLVFILLIPDTVYHGWIALFRAGKQGGSVSRAFIIPATIFSSLGACRLITGKDKKHEVLVTVILITLVILIMVPSPPVLFIFTLLLFFLFIRNIPAGGRKNALFFLFALFLLPGLTGKLAPAGDGKPPGSPFIDGISRSIHRTIISVFPEFPLFFHIPGYGYTHETGNLTGGKPLLSSRPIFSVKGSPGEILYLRTDTSCIYSGGGWITGKPGDITERAAESGTETVKGKTRIEITLLGDLFTRLPVNPEAGGIGFREKYYSLEMASVKGAGILPPGEIPFRRGEVLTVYSGNPFAGSSDNLTEYTLRLDTVPEIENLAQGFSGKEEKEILRDIRKWLASEYTYSLETKASEDPVTDFLFTSFRGYCLHFASAGVILAGLNGIPVRLARGFLVVLPGEDSFAHGEIPGETFVSGYSAHVWPEILDEDGRWIPWEVTPPMADAAEAFLPAGDRLTMTQLERLGLFSPDRGESGEAESTKEEKKTAGIKRILIPTAIFALCLAVFLMIRPGRTDRILRRTAIRVRRRQGIPLPDEIGWKEWGARLTALSPGEEEQIKKILSSVLRRIYRNNNEPLKVRDLRRLAGIASKPWRKTSGRFSANK